MRAILSILVLFGVFFSVNSQNIFFIKSYGNSGYDYGRDIKQDLDTGYIATGSSSSFASGNADAFLLKVDSLGNFKWSYNYGGTGSDWGESVILTLDSGYAISGFTNSFGNGGFDFYFVKAKNDGTPLIQRTYGGSDWDKGAALGQLSDSGYVLVGETYSYGNGLSDIYIVRTDKFGDTLWTKTFGGPERDYATDVLIDGDSIVVVGGTESFGSGMSDGIILKYHNDGTLGWVKFAGMERDDHFTSITSNFSGTEYFLGGSRLYYYDQTGYLDDFWIYNISADGNILYADTSLTGGSHEVDIAYDIAVDPIENIFFCGSTKSYGIAVTDGYSDAWIGKLLNNYYQASFISTFGVQGEDVLYGMDYCWDGIVTIGQLAYGSSGGANMIIAKADWQNTGSGFQVQTELVNEEITLSLESIGENELLQFDVYPTIVSTEINIEGINQEITYEIYSISGKIEAKGILNDGLLNVSFLETGVYILVLKSTEGIYTSKFFKD